MSKTQNDMSPTLTALKKQKRDSLLALINQCTEKQQHTFKLGFSHKNPDLPLDEIVNNMLEEKLDTAIMLCERTIAHNEGKPFGAMSNGTILYDLLATGKG